MSLLRSKEKTEQTAERIRSQLRELGDLRVFTQHGGRGGGGYTQGARSLFINDNVTIDEVARLTGVPAGTISSMRSMHRKGKLLDNGSYTKSPIGVARASLYKTIPSRQSTRLRMARAVQAVRGGERAISIIAATLGVSPHTAGHYLNLSGLRVSYQEDRVEVPATWVAPSIDTTEQTEPANEVEKSLETGGEEQEPEGSAQPEENALTTSQLMLYALHLVDIAAALERAADKIEEMQEENRKLESLREAIRQLELPTLLRDDV